MNTKIYQLKAKMKEKLKKKNTPKNIERERERDNLFFRENYAKNRKGNNKFIVR